MLDMGFENDMRKIINQCGMPEKTQRQTLMFSATFPDEIQKLAREFLNDYLFLAVGSVGGSNLDIKQEVLDVQGNQKRSVLMEILGQSGAEKFSFSLYLKHFYFWFAVVYRIGTG
jgi:superfamily II DNA/RNA helicase